MIQCNRVATQQKGWNSLTISKISLTPSVPWWPRFTIFPQEILLLANKPLYWGHKILCNIQLMPSEARLEFFFSQISQWWTCLWHFLSKIWQARCEIQRIFPNVLIKIPISGPQLQKKAQKIYNSHLESRQRLMALPEGDHLPSGPFKGPLNFL